MPPGCPQAWGGVSLCAPASFREPCRQSFPSRREPRHVGHAPARLGPKDPGGEPWVARTRGVTPLGRRYGNARGQVKVRESPKRGLPASESEPTAPLLDGLILVQPLIITLSPGLARAFLADHFSAPTWNSGRVSRLVQRRNSRSPPTGDSTGCDDRAAPCRVRGPLRPLARLALR